MRPGPQFDFTCQTYVNSAGRFWRDAHPAIQFVKYGIAGGLATVHIAVFYTVPCDSAGPGFGDPVAVWAGLAGGADQRCPARIAGGVE